MSSPFGNSIFKILSTVKPLFNNAPFRNIAIFGKSKKKEEESPYIIMKATKDDHGEMLKVMRESYFREEPTCCSLGITHDAVLEEEAMKAMEESLSIVAKCKYDGCVVGACINEACHPWDPDVKEQLACHVKCPKVRSLLLFYAHMQRAPNLWNCFGVHKIFEMAYLFVKREHRKKGLGYRLLQDSKTLGADCGFGVLRCDATSANSATLCEKLNMTKIYEIPYCSYLGLNLEPVFNPPYPHDICRVYVDTCPQWSELMNKKKKKKKRQRRK